MECGAMFVVFFVFCFPAELMVRSFSLSRFLLMISMCCSISFPKCRGLTAHRAAILSFQSNPKRLASMIFNVQPGVAKPYNVKNLSLWKHLPVFCQTCLTVRFSLKRLFSHYAPSLLASFSGTNLLTASINLQFTFY